MTIVKISGLPISVRLNFTVQKRSNFILLSSRQAKLYTNLWEEKPMFNALFVLILALLYALAAVWDGSAALLFL